MQLQPALGRNTRFGGGFSFHALCPTAQHSTKLASQLLLPHSCTAHQASPTLHHRVPATHTQAAACKGLHTPSRMLHSHNPLTEGHGSLPVLHQAVRSALLCWLATPWGGFLVACLPAATRSTSSRIRMRLPQGSYIPRPSPLRVAFARALGTAAALSKHSAQRLAEPRRLAPCIMPSPPPAPARPASPVIIPRPPAPTSPLLPPASSPSSTPASSPCPSSPCSSSASPSCCRTLPARHLGCQGRLVVVVDEGLHGVVDAAALGGAPA